MLQASDEGRKFVLDLNQPMHIRSVLLRLYSFILFCPVGYSETAPDPLFDGANVSAAEKGRTKYQTVRQGIPAWSSAVGTLNPTPVVNLQETDDLRTFDVYAWKDTDEDDVRGTGEWTDT